MSNFYQHIFAFLATLQLSTLVFSEDVVIHPVPKKPIFVADTWYATLKGQLPSPPSKGSPQQKNDENILRQIQKSRTNTDCERAKATIFVSLKSFFGSPYGPLSDKDSAALSDFFEQLRNDGDYFIQLLKKDFPRQRPFLYLKDINPCVGKEVTGAYPSGHAVLAKLYELVLVDFFPNLKDKLAARAKQIGDDRVLSGMHHPSDVEAGRKLGELIYGEFKKSKKYAEDFAKNRIKI